MWRLCTPRSLALGITHEEPPAQVDFAHNPLVFQLEGRPHWHRDAVAIRESVQLGKGDNAISGTWLGQVKVHGYTPA